MSVGRSVRPLDGQEKTSRINATVPGKSNHEKTKQSLFELRIEFWLFRESNGKRFSHDFTFIGKM